MFKPLYLLQAATPVKQDAGSNSGAEGQWGLGQYTQDVKMLPLQLGISPDIFLISQESGISVSGYCEVFKRCIFCM